MLSILLLILKIIGIIILSLLGIIIFFALFVLFIPITYKVEGEIHNNIESLKISGNISWLLCLTKALFEYKHPDLFWKAYFLWFKLSSEDEEKERTVKKPKKKKKKKTNNKSEEVPRTEKKEPVEKTEKVIEKEIEDEAIFEEFESRKNKTDSAKKKSKNNFSKTIRELCDKIKAIINKKDEAIIFLNQKSTQHSIKKLKKECLYLWKWSKPSKIKIDAELGFEDPSITGKMLGVMGVLYGIYGNTIQITPNFEEVIYNGSFIVKGYTMAFPFVKTVIVLLLDKQVIRTYKQLKEYEF